MLQFRLAVHTDPRRAAAYEVSRFLAGFSVRHAPRFDEWLAATRQALVHEYEHLLGDLARHALAHGRWREATEFADHWLACDPLSDEAARMSIEARYLAGDRGAALARFREYAATLKREAGCEPSRALLGLVHRVESDTSATAPRPAITDEWPVNAPAFDSSLLGREAEWSVLARSWKAARRGGGAIVLIEGEAGVGKTRLAGDLLRWVVADGGIALRGRSGDVRAGFPFASAVEVLRDMLAAPGLPAPRRSGWPSSAVSCRSCATGFRRSRALPPRRRNRRLPPVRSGRAGSAQPVRREPDRRAPGRPAVVRRRELQPVPVPHPPTRGGAGAVAALRHAR